MTGPSLAARADPVLIAFLDAPDEEAARVRLGELLEREATPLAREVIRGHLRGEQGDDLEDVHAGVLLSLAEHLRGVRTGGDEAPIRSFASYVATVSHNACHAFLRRRFPARARLRSQARYVLTRDPHLAFWEGRGRHWLCGQAAWRDGAWEPRSTPQLVELSRSLGPLPFPELVRTLIARLPGPARFDDLVDALARIQGITDAVPSVGADEETDAAGEIADPGPSAEQALAERDFLARIWDEIARLPVRQRAALLLNLRDAEGRGMIGLLPLTGVADVPEIARALEMPEAELRGLWDDLPRDDAWIAERLQATRRQVINLRKCARECLARRMKGVERW